MSKKSMQRVVVELAEVNKAYEVRHQRPTFIETFFTQKRAEIFIAARSLNLRIYKGQRVGIIGANGSGKTTLLKLICGITTPNTGKILVNGKVVSLIDLEAGFHPDLTGEENILLNGLVIGMSKKEIKRSFGKIVEFADIGEFIDAPLYTYSAGMTLRLAFAVAVHSQPDILLLDENILAGDKEFQDKVLVKIEEIFAQKKTVVMVSHWLDYLRYCCQRIIWIEHGEIREDGGHEVIDHYLESTQ